MPTYLYKCEECGAEFEVLQKIDAPNPDCVECGSEKVKKQITQAGVIFKGNGFYSNDYGGKNPSI